MSKNYYQNYYQKFVFTLLRMSKNKFNRNSLMIIFVKKFLKGRLDRALSNLV